MRTRPRLGARHLGLAMLALLAVWLVVVVTGVDQEFPNDYAAFYSMARGMRLFGLGITSQIYSVHVQYLLESFIRSRAGRSLAIPFVNPPLAAWMMLPFSLLPLRAAYLCWDLVALLGCGVGMVWLARCRPRSQSLWLLALALLSSYPAYLALGQGQLDLLWPLGGALLASSLEFTAARRYLPRAAMAGLIVALKPDLFIGLLVPALAGWRRAQVRVLLLTLLGLGAATAFILGPTGLAQAAHLELFTIARRFPPSLDMTVTGMAYRALGPGPWVGWIGLAAIPLGVAGLAWAWWRNPPRSDVDWWLSLTTATCVSLLIAPHDLVQGLVLLGVPMVLVAKALQARGRGLGPLAFWVLAFDLSTVVDMSPHLYLPLRITPLLLLAAAVSSWRARSSLTQPALAPRPEVAPDPSSAML